MIGGIEYQHEAIQLTIDFVILETQLNKGSLNSRFLKYFCLVVCGILCSCTVALPEFQTAASLEKGKQQTAFGGFSGRGLNASTGGCVNILQSRFYLTIKSH